MIIKERMKNMTVAWIIVGILLVILELMTTYFLVIFFAIGAFATALVSLVIDDMSIQLIVFSVISLGGLVLGKDTLKKYFEVNKEIKSSNVEALKGKMGVVTKEITLNEYGLVKVEGDVWTATGLDNETIRVGEEVFVEYIDGVKLVVYAKNN